MQTTKTENFERLEKDLKKWVSLDGEYTDFEITQTLAKDNGDAGFFLVEHKESAEIVFAWNSPFNSEIQLSVEFKSDGTPQQKKIAKDIFLVFASRLN